MAFSSASDLAGPEPAANAAPGLSSWDIEDIDNEICYQKAILASLLDTPNEPDILGRTERARAEITRLKKRLADARGQGTASTDSPANMNSNRVLGQQQTSGYSSPFTMSTPGSSTSMWSGGELPRPPSHLKRSYTSHLDGGNDNKSESKSRRTTPSPAPYAFHLPPPNDPFVDLTGFLDDNNDDVIDLTGIDDEIIKQQDAEMASYRTKKETADSDAEIARLFQETGRFGAQPFSGPSAYDRMLGRSSQATTSAVRPELFSWPDGRVKPEQVKPEGVEPEARDSSRPPSGEVSFRMPGSFFDDDEDDAGLSGVSGAFSSRPSAISFNTGPYMPHFPALPSRPSAISQAYGSSAANLSHHASTPSLGAFPTPPPFTNLPSNPALYTNANYPPAWPQPPSISLPGLGYTLPPVPSVKSQPLEDVIRRTAFPEYPFPWSPHPVHDSEEDIKDLISNIRPDEEIPAELRGSTPDALRYPLYPHQQLALEWMKKMEEGTNKGGILADDMGLGKTISTLALMVSRRSENRLCRTNLIIGPVALIKQWESEIKQKLRGGNHAMTVFLLHNRKATYEDLRVYDVVLTTYGTLAQEWKRYHKWVAEHPDLDAFNDATLAKNHPLVHPKNAWFRVILDEAQCIKNKETQGSKGAQQITATYRWCLTGTPMMNSISELYSLFRFLRIKPYQDHKKFNESFSGLTARGATRTYGDMRETQMQRLRAVLKATMLRRMKNSLIDGKPILNLPPKREVSTHVVFSDDELNFYKQLEGKAQVQFNRYLRAGTIGKNYSNILVLLLRLREACCHPHLNMDFETVAAANPLEDMIALAGQLAPAVVGRIKEIEAFECPICYDAAVNPFLVLPCGHDTCADCFQRLIGTSLEDNIRGGDENARGAKCPQCRGAVDPKRAIDYHTFVRVHMPEKAAAMGLVTESDKTGADVEDADGTDSDEDTSSGDGSDVGKYVEDYTDRYGNLRGFVVNDANDFSDADVSDADGAEKKPKPKKDRKSKGKGKKKADAVQPHMLKKLRQEAHKNAESRRKYMRYLRDNWQSSAKVDKACEILEGLKASGEKTIIFSVWTGLLDLLEIPIKYRLHLKYCRYDGAMSASHRDAAARTFQSDPRVTVMLVSLKAGNAGLNLTAASQVIIMDPFWNPYIEMQAVDRAHRIGQQREVHVHRILVQGTVEDRIVELQEQKRALVDAALDEGANKNIGRLDARQLRFLFGVNG